MTNQFLNDVEDIKWLFEVHLKDRPDLICQGFRSFVLYGNEDAPNRVDLYLDFDPLFTDIPTTVMFISGDLVNEV